MQFLLVYIIYYSGLEYVQKSYSFDLWSITKVIFMEISHIAPPILYGCKISGEIQLQLLSIKNKSSPNYLPIIISKISLKVFMSWLIAVNELVAFFSVYIFFTLLSREHDIRTVSYKKPKWIYMKPLPVNEHLIMHADVGHSIHDTDHTDQKPKIFMLYKTLICKGLYEFSIPMLKIYSSKYLFYDAKVKKIWLFLLVLIKYKIFSCWFHACANWFLLQLLRLTKKYNSFLFRLSVLKRFA